MFSFFRKNVPNQSLVAFVDGDILPLSKVSDPVFAEKMLGDGIAILPRSEHIVAPCDGEITMIYPTLHAFAIKNKDDLEILIHIGINTVALKGKGFKQHVQVGDHVKRKDKIISFEYSYLKNKNYDFTTLMLFPNCDKKLTIKTKGNVYRGRDIVVAYE